MIDFEQLSVFKLSKGKHVAAEEGVCAMEAVAWLEGLPHSDRPECTCPVIAAYVRVINDECPDRQRLVPYLPRLVGTVSPEHEQKRAEYLAWQAIHVFAPAALRSAGMEEEADRLAQFDGTLGDAANVASVIANDAYTGYTQTAGHGAASSAASARWSAEHGEAAFEAVDRARARAYLVAAATCASEAAGRAAAWDEAFAALDRILAIGPQSPGFSKPIEQRVAKYRELIDD